MLKYWERRFKSGILTEHPEFDERMKALRKRLQGEVKRKFAGSLAIRMVDSGSCNACEAECNALSNPYYDLERLGIHFVASPRHADVMLLSGVLTFNMLPHVLDAWEQIPAPKWSSPWGIARRCRPLLPALSPSPLRLRSICPSPTTSPAVRPVRNGSSKGCSIFWRTWSVKAIRPLGMVC